MAKWPLTCPDTSPFDRRFVDRHRRIDVGDVAVEIDVEAAIGDARVEGRALSRRRRRRWRGRASRAPSASGRGPACRPAPDVDVAGHRPGDPRIAAASETSSAAPSRPRSSPSSGPWRRSGWTQAPARAVPIEPARTRAALDGGIVEGHRGVEARAVEVRAGTARRWRSAGAGAAPAAAACGTSMPSTRPVRSKRTPFWPGSRGPIVPARVEACHRRRGRVARGSVTLGPSKRPRACASAGRRSLRPRRRVGHLERAARRHLPRRRSGGATRNAARPSTRPATAGVFDQRPGSMCARSTMPANSSG